MSETTTQTPAQAKAARYGARKPKVPPFARYRGTSAWRSDKRRVKAYKLFKAATRQD